MSEITVAAFKNVNNAGALQALVSVRVGSVIFHDFRVVQQEGKRAWVSVPQQSWVDEETGERRFKNLIELPRELKKKVDAVVLEAYEDGRSNEQ